MRKDKMSKVLIVDDMSENISVLTNVLDDMICQAAKTGAKALEIARTTPCPDIILLDIMMPEMDGYQVIEALKSDEKTRDIPVIFLTALADAADETYGFELGAVDYITKPVSPPVVRARVKNHLELQHTRKLLEDQNRELIAAAELRDDVDRIMRHDLKSPLSSILGNAQLLGLIQTLDPEEKNYVNAIQEEAYHMLDLINRSMDIYKIEQGIYEYHPVQFDIVKVVHWVFRELIILSHAFGVKLQLYLNGHPIHNEKSVDVMGEEFLSYAMLSNLVKNAIEASKKEGAEVKVDIQNKNGLEIIIHNEGAVPEQMRNCFFDKYTTYGKAKGIGLGTYSAKLAMETMRGRISMQTSESNGTTIRLKFPLS